MNFEEAITIEEDTTFVAYFDNYPIYMSVDTTNNVYSVEWTHVPEYRHSEVVLETLVWEEL